MKFCILASGSKGNCTYIEKDNVKILIDFGTTVSYISDKLKEIGISLANIDAIILTHSHSDHVNGLPVLHKKYKIPIYLSPSMYGSISNKPVYYEFINNSEFYIKELLIRNIKTSHDVPSLGYIIEDLVYITDTGYLNNRYFPLLKNKKVYILESNHDVQMLMDGDYPYHIKQRVVGDMGHLSNKDCSFYLSKLIGEETKKIVLAHISENNNKKYLAFETLINTLPEFNRENILLAEQYERSELIEI